MRIAAALLVLSSMAFLPITARADGGIGPGFGVQVEAWRTPPGTLDEIKEAGFTWLRYGISWEPTETSRGNYNWSRNDKFIASVKERGLNSIIILMGGHKDYTGTVDAPADDPDHLKTYTLSPEKPEDVAAFAAFAAATAKHYGSKGMIYEIWNEPDLPTRFWHPHSNPAAYATLAAATCKAIKEAVPDAKVIGPGTAAMPGRGNWLGKPEFTATLLKSPAADCLDAISFHSYRYSRLDITPKTPESIIADNQNARTYVDEHGGSTKKLPFVSSEWGYTLTMLSPELQSAYVLRTYLSNLASGVPLTIWYEWADRGSDKSDSEAHYGLVNKDRSPKPALAVVQAVLPQIKDAKFERRLEAEDPNVYLLVLKQPDGALTLAFWSAAAQVTGKMVHVNEGNAARDYPLTATPQIVNLGRNVPSVTVRQEPQP